MPQAVPYLSFDGTCAEAMRFYERALGLGAKLELMISGADTPIAEHIPPADAHRIMHARIAFADGSWLFAGDARTDVPYEGMKGITVTLNYPTVAEAARAFEALAPGGNVTMAPQPTFRAKSFAMLVDRYGTPWILNGELLEQEADAGRQPTA